MNAKTYLTTIQAFAGALHCELSGEDLKIGSCLIAKSDYAFRGEASPYNWDDKKEHIKVTLEEMKKAHIFELDNDTTKMLALTNVPKDLNMKEIRFPFPYIFLDTLITRENLFDIYDKTIHGVFARIDTLFDAEGKECAREVRYFMASEDNDKIWTNTGSFPLETREDMTLVIEKDDIELDKNHVVIKNLIFNFILFLNNPEVQVVEVVRTAKNDEKRIRKGKLPLPCSSKIYLTGMLRQYVDKLNSGGSFNYSHRFWVRGHYRTLHDINMYKDKVGTRIWIMPFVKGEGILIDKTYRLKKAEEVENEPK